MEDDYRYQQKSLPPITPIGGDNFSASEVAKVSFDDIGNPVAGIPQEQSPYSNPDFTGGGGGGGGFIPPSCATNWTIGGIRSSSVELPCSGTVFGVVTAGTISVSQSGGDSASIIAESGVLELISSGKTIYLQASAIGDESGDVDLKELDVAHMGAPGKRQFVCGDAYAA